MPTQSPIRLWGLGAILGVCFIAGISVLAFTYYTVRQFDNSLSVTGSAKVRVTSDSARWSSTFERSVPVEQLALGYAQMKADEEKVTAYFVERGFAKEDITVSPVVMEAPFKYNPGAPREYQLQQNVELLSSDAVGVTALAKDVQGLIDQGVVFSSQSVEYTYSKLPETRVSLLSDAVRDAQDRAGKIAGSTGRGVGALKSAAMGVVQVLPINSTDISDYGAYDTSSIEKEVMVTVKAVFVVK